MRDNLLQGDKKEIDLEFIDNLKFDEKGLIPAVVQDIDSKEVLMLAYMNKESMKETLINKKACYFSRSRKALWTKGETSGNTQELKGFYYDCDKDTVLLKVRQKGVACHTGSYSCFFNEVLQNSEMSQKELIERLYDLIKDREVISCYIDCNFWTRLKHSIKRKDGIIKTIKRFINDIKEFRKVSVYDFTLWFNSTQEFYDYIKEGKEEEL